MSMTSDVTALRLQLRAAGFSPLPTEGKAPPMAGWSQKFDATDDEIRLWPKTWQLANNTGVLAKFCPGLDIDIAIPDPAAAVEALAREFFEEHGDIHVRFGKPPRRLIVLRTDEPFAKLVRKLIAPDGSAQKIEILGDGQQYIVAGIHPETKRPYSWRGGELETIRREDLPYVRREDMERFLDNAVQLLVTEFGFTDQSAAQQGNGGERHERADTRWRELNERALANLDKWVTKLFPTAKKTNAGGYRVKSADLGRGFEEDLSLDPRGIKYFGIQDMGDPRQGRRTPIDIVIEWNHVELLDAVSWLEQALDQPAPQEPPPKEPPPKQYRFALKPFDSISVSTVPSYLIKGVLPRTGLVVVWGSPKCGKSFWTFDAVMHVVLGREYRGCRVQQGTAVYCALEGGSGFAARIEAWRKHHLARYDQPVPFYLIDVSLDLVADQAALIADIRAQLGDIAPALIVIDTLNRAIQGDENSSGDMSKFIRAADALRTAFGCLVVVVHHCGIVANRPRGHTSLAGADDAQIAIERNEDGIIVATVEHMKDAEAGKKLACKLDRVELGDDLEGDLLSSCVIIPTEMPNTGPKLSKGTRAALDLLKDLIAEEGVPLPAGISGVPDGTPAVLQKAWRETFIKQHAAETYDGRKRAFNRAIAELMKLQLIEVYDEFAWLPDNRDNRDNRDRTTF